MRGNGRLQYRTAAQAREPFPELRPEADRTLRRVRDGRHHHSLAAHGQAGGGVARRGVSEGSGGPHGSGREIAAGQADCRDRRLGVLRQAAKALWAAQLSRSTSAAWRNSLASTMRLPFRSTRGPMISIVPEIPSCQEAETRLSGEAMNSPAWIVMSPPCPRTACATIRLRSSTTTCGSIAMLPPFPKAPPTEVVIALRRR